MPFKIVRNDITKMNTQAIVNTANEYATVGTGCDSAIYNAAGYEELLAFRKEKVGDVPEGEVFMTPGYNLKARYIIHAVSPLYINGNSGEEEKLRSCYRKSLRLALENGITSIAFPLISTGGFGYPKEEGMRIAVDEINAFLLRHDMMIYLVVFGDKTTAIGGKLYPDLEEYIDQNYVDQKWDEEYGDTFYAAQSALYDHNAFGAYDEYKEDTYDEYEEDDDESDGAAFYRRTIRDRQKERDRAKRSSRERFSKASRESLRKSPRRLLRKDSKSVFESEDISSIPSSEPFSKPLSAPSSKLSGKTSSTFGDDIEASELSVPFDEEHESRLEERMKHLSDTFSEYLLYLIKDKNMDNVEVYKRAIVDKKIFSKIKNNVNYHPQKLTALCLCVGAKLNLDESKDLLARAGYALSPCDMTDIIFSYFIENEIYDMIELDIQLEEHGLPCIIS